MKLFWIKHNHGDKHCIIDDTAGAKQPTDKIKVVG